VPTPGPGWQFVRQQLQREAYDAVIDLHGLAKSAAGGVDGALERRVGQRYAMAHQTDGSSYEAPAPAGWPMKPSLAEPHSHAVDRSREALCPGIGLCGALRDYAFGLLAHTSQALCSSGEL
jgi:heptosyltransferase-1